MAGKLVLRFLNVGQGDATHVILPNGEHMLVDMNLDHSNRGIDVVKYLTDELPSGEDQKSLAYLVNTHPHDDHIRGMGGLGNTFEIGEMWHSGHERDCKEGENPGYDKFVKLVDELGNRAIKVCAGAEPWAEIDGVTFHVFRPSSYVKPKSNMTESEKREAIHNECMVLKITYAGKAVMLTGDSNLCAWRAIMKHYDKDGLLKADVLHASHHGSRSFFKEKKEDEACTGHLEAIAPTTVVVSVGKKNDYGHPDADAMEEYEKDGRTIYRTDKNLTIELTIDENGNLNWAMDDQNFQDRYELPDPDDSDKNESKSKAAQSLGAYVYAGSSRTRLPDKSPVA